MRSNAFLNSTTAGGLRCRILVQGFAHVAVLRQASRNARRVGAQRKIALAAITASATSRIIPIPSEAWY